MKSINLTDEEAKELVTFYSCKLKEAEAIVSRYKGLLDKLYKEQNISNDERQLKLVDDSSKERLIDFNGDWTWTQKIDFILEESGKPLTKKQVVNKLFIYEPSLGETKDKRQATSKSIGATLSRQTTNGRYKTIKTTSDSVNRYGI